MIYKNEKLTKQATHPTSPRQKGPAGKPSQNKVVQIFVANFLFKHINASKLLQYYLKRLPPSLSLFCSKLNSRK
jgi:hypothetical protein